MNNRNYVELDELIQRNYSVDTGRFISRGWEIFKQNLGGFIGFLLVSLLINIGLALIPLAGSIASAIISGPLNAGNFIVAFKIGKRQQVTFSDFFKGFQNSYFLNLFLATLVIGLFIGASFLPFALMIVLGVQMGVRPIILGLLGILLIAPGIYLAIAYIFTVPLIVGKKMEFWPAMEASRKLITKKWTSFFGFSLVLTLINFAGVLLCGVGLLFTAPLTICAIAAAYESIVGLPVFDPSQA